MDVWGWKALFSSCLQFVSCFFLKCFFVTWFKLVILNGF